MPIYDFTCEDCQKTLELLVQNPDLAPKRCGAQCLLAPGENDEVRGMGKLHRHLANFHVGNFAIVTDHPTPADAAKVGLSTYKNEGDGVYRKIEGKTGPDVIKR
jgi:hypothetical protein